MGPLLRWSHSCLFVECPYFVPHPSSYPTNVPLLFLSVTLPSSCFYPKLHFPSGDLGPSTFEKKVTLFVIFLAGFSLCSDIVQECMAGKQEGNCLISILYYSVDQFQQGFRERAEGEGENRIRAPTILFLLLFYLNFKDRDIQTCWRQSSGCCLLHSLERLGFLSGRQTAGGAQWLNVFGRHWPPPVQSDRWATVGVGGTSSEWGFFFFFFFF